MRLRSDEQLLVAFRTGSEAAFAAIHDRYRQRLLAYARQMLGGSRQDAEDVLQDVFLRAYAMLRTDGRAVVLRPWLYRVAHNRCVDQLRRPAPAPVEIGEDSVGERPSASLPDPIESAQRREELARLVVDIRRLPEQQRSALLMREIDGMSYGELAGALEVSMPAVKSLLVRARMGLAEAGEARDAACGDIRADLADSHDRGVRISGHARRHLRDCDGCTRFRVALRATSAAMGALVPGGPGPFAALAQAIGLGGGGSGAVAGGGWSAVGSAGGMIKVAALVGTAAIAAGGAGTAGLGGG
ncbi:MAG TPA: RNA polymerase sigma factor, partial [Solirubrobacteraceae bacterium]|nr:RNA polymerase sigma factor [Solirubrobacteraceae bacterium]